MSKLDNFFALISNQELSQAFAGPRLASRLACRQVMGSQ